jgi:hypothetical protein
MRVAIRSIRERFQRPTRCAISSTANESTTPFVARS